MPLPPEVQTIRLYGKFLTPAGQPQRGFIKFKPAVPTTGSGVVIPRTGIVRQLNSDGYFSVELPTGQNTGLDPDGWTYDVSERFADGAYRNYSITLSVSPAEQDISTLTPVPAVNPGVTYATIGQLNDVEARLNKVENRSSAPTDPVPGQMYYDTEDGRIYFWNGLDWISMRGGDNLDSLSLPGELSVAGDGSVAGNVSIGGVVSPQAQLDVRTAGSHHTVQSTQTTTSPVAYANYGAILGTASNRYFDGRVTGDSSGRIVIRGDGSIWLGAGDSSGQDVNAYREAANVLRTDDRLVVGGNIADVDSYANLPKGHLTRSNSGSLILCSSPAGGDDDGVGTDSTGRIISFHYQRANVGSFGEWARHMMMRSDAKAMDTHYVPVLNGKVAYDPATRAPLPGAQWKPASWTGSHFEANNHGSIHGHWELEIPDSTGALQGRLEAPFIDQSKLSNGLSNTVFGVDWTNLRTNLADFSVRAQNITSGDYAGQNTALRVGGNNTVNKDLLLSISSDMQNSGRRWIVRANTDTESGGNAGTNFQLIRCGDDGTTLGSALFIERRTGYITSGASGAAGAKLALIWGASGTHGVSVQPSSSPGSAAGFDAAMTVTTDRAFQASVAGDPSRRIVVFADGKFEWGDGTNARDLNLYRAAVGRLKTDGNFHVAGQLGVGSVPNGNDACTVVLASDANVLNLMNTTPGGNTSAPLIRGEVATLASLILTTRVTGESASRFLLTPDGKMQWGDGSAAKDTALYRSNAGTLKTDTKLYVGTTLGVGTVPDAANKLSIVQAADANTINSVNTLAGGNVNQPHVYLESATAASIGVSSRVTGDTSSRFLQLVNGELQWGPGNAARDTKLYRSAAQTMTLEGSLRVTGDFRHLGSTLGFYNAPGVAKPTVTGSLGGNAALASVVSALATLGLVNDSTTA